MPTKPIVLWPDPRLMAKSVEVPQLAISGLKGLIQDMWDTLYNVKGIGLAAIQIGNAVRVLVMDAKKPYVLINPVITSFDGIKEKKNESCLSLPGVVEEIERYDGVQVTYLDENGEPHAAVFTGLEAQCIQHEIDHLDGITMPDKVGAFERERIRKYMKNRGKK